jgi:maleylacetoacetate isomerase
MSLPRLYTYFRSGAAQRVRIGLALKGVAYESIPVHLVRNGGEHLLPAFKAINPQARVPVMELSGGAALAQSSAILEYLEETFPEPPLLPAAPIERAEVRRVAAIIGCDIHPLNNVGPLNELHRCGWSDVQVAAWISKWITLGLEARRAIDWRRGVVLRQPAGSRRHLFGPPAFLRPALQGSGRPSSADIARCASYGDTSSICRRRTRKSTGRRVSAFNSSRSG